MAITINGSGSIAGVTNLTTTGVALEDAALTDPAITGGIYIGGTGAATYLDDYEEGSFSPTMWGGSGGSITYTQNSGYYVKIGKMVYVTFSITIASTSLSGTIYFNGFPFAPNDAQWGRNQFSTYGVDLPAYSDKHLYPAGANFAILYDSDNGGWSVGSTSNTNIAAGDYFTASMWYTTNS